MIDTDPLIVLLDTSILYPARIRDILLQLAVQDLFTPKWSYEIRQELIDSIRNTRPDIADHFYERTIRQMDAVLKDAFVVNFEHHTKDLILPDRNDRHILAAAIQGQCDLIVTANLRDFPGQILDSWGIDSRSPDEFLSLLLSERPNDFIEAVRIILNRLTSPSLTPEDYLDNMEEIGLISTANKLRQHVQHLG